MAPEALQEEPLYTAKLDVFQAGVLMVQIITRKFPDPTRANRKVRDPRSPTGIIWMPVPEIERRHNHLSLIADTHSMVSLIRDCLKDEEEDRPTTQQLCQQLSTLKDVAQYSQSQQEGEDGGQMGDEGIRERVREVEVREREVERRERKVQGMLEEVGVREKEVGRREKEVGRRESEVGERLQVKDHELQQEREEKERLSRRLDMTNVKVQQMQEKHQQMENQLRDEIKQIRDDKDQLLEKKDRNIHELQSLSVAVVYTYEVSGPGLRSATINYSTHITVELRDQSGQPCLVPQKITAELEEIDALVQQSFWFRKKTAQKKIPQKLPVDIAADFPSQYNVSFTVVTRGQHKLHVQHNNSEINGSPFTITVYPDPTQLGIPVRVVTKLNKPYGVAINSHGEMIVSEFGADRVSVLDSAGKVIRRFGSESDRPEQMVDPTGVAVDRDDNVYVASDHKLQKFSRDGHLIKTVGHKGNKEGEFDCPKGVRLYNNHVYVCDGSNHRIQVFDCELNFIRTIGSHGSGRGEFNKPYDLDFDAEGNAYIADYFNNRIQVLDASSQFIRQIGHEEGEGRLKEPAAVHIIGEFVYVSDSNHHIAVYETSGQFVSSFGKYSKGVGEFDDPRCITSDRNGFIYVCDWWNNRIVIL